MDDLREIRPLRPEDVGEQLALDQFAFQFEMSPGDLEEARRNTNPDDVVACYIDGRLAAKLELLRMNTYIGGRRIAMGGIAGVATWPEYRRGGIVADLLRHSLRLMREQGLTVSHLTPFAFSFYRRYGWEHCIDRKQYTLERADWPSFASATGSIKRTDDYADVAPVYEQFASRYNGTLSRSEMWWKRRIARSKPGIMAVYYDDTDSPTGYIIYRVKSGDMTIHELVHLTEDARRGLWNFVRNHDSMASKVTFVAPVDDVLPFLLDNPRIKQEILPYFMVRIVDVASFLRQYSFTKASEKREMTITVTDPNAPWNEKTFIVAPEATGALVAVENEPGEVLHVSCDVQTLTAMLTGYRRPTDLFTVGRLSGSEEAILAWETAIPFSTTFLYDFF